MLKITQSAITQKQIHQNQKNKILFWTTYFYTFLKNFDSKFKIPIATEGCSIFDVWEIGT